MDRGVVQDASAQPPEKQGQEGPKYITMPLLVTGAPSAFKARKYNLERLRKGYGISYRKALELVLAGLLVEAVERSDPGRSMRGTA